MGTVKPLLGTIALGVTAFAILAGFILVLHMYADHQCRKLSNEAGVATVYRNGYCHMEIAPELFVKEEDVKYYLHSVDLSE